MGRDRADGCVLCRVLGNSNQFGSALGDSVRDAPFRNAERIIDIEQAMGLYVEVDPQHLPSVGLVHRLLNVFYGTFHFAVTIGAMVLLFARHPERYTFMRSTLAATTGVALVGFAFFPLMPPRLLGNCTSQFGACEDGFDYTDTLVDPGGLWSFESGTMETISNQYAAMPSLHIAWAIWCTVALYPVLHRVGPGPDRGLPDRNDVRDRRHGESLLA